MTADEPPGSPPAGPKGSKGTSKRPRNARGTRHTATARTPPGQGTFLGAFINFARTIVALASWALALAFICALMSRFAVPLFPEDVTTRGLLLLSPMTLGACIGKSIDRRAPARPRKSR
jgi:hypothetical protein